MRPPPARRLDTFHVTDLQRKYANFPHNLSKRGASCAMGRAGVRSVGIAQADTASPGNLARREEDDPGCGQHLFHLAHGRRRDEDGHSHLYSPVRRMWAHGNLMNFMRGLRSIGKADGVLAIFDNDTVGVASLAQLEKLFKAVNGRSSPYQKPAMRPSCALYPHGIKS